MASGINAPGPVFLEGSLTTGSELCNHVVTWQGFYIGVNDNHVTLFELRLHGVALNNKGKSSHAYLLCQIGVYSYLIHTIAGHIVIYGLFGVSCLDVIQHRDSPNFM